MKSVKEVAAKWGVSAERVLVLCREGRIEGAALVGGTWVIPARVRVLKAGRERPGKIKLQKKPPARKPGAK